MFAGSGSGAVYRMRGPTPMTRTYELRKSLICDLSLSPVRMLTRSLPNLHGVPVSAFNLMLRDGKYHL